MTHPDDDALLALVLPDGQTSQDVPGVRDHVQDCSRCAAEVAAHRRVVDTAVAGIPEDLPQMPPERVWDAVVAGTGGTGGGSLQAGAARTTGSRTAQSRTAEPPAPSAASVPTPPRTDGDRWPPRQRSHRRRALVAAGAVGVVLGVVAGAAGHAALAGGEEDPAVVATAQLEPLAGTSATPGSAVLHGAADDLVLDVDAPDVPVGGGYQEVWLLDDTGERLVSLGVLQAGAGSFVVPAGIDVDEYGVVDVSQEALDGDPGHSGSSLVRGPLDL